MHYNYDEVIDIIQNTRRFGNFTGYEVSKNMLEQLGNPQSGIPFVHIAGTNGKGSTTAFLTNILEQTGKKVGMFTSPHLITFRERIRINGEYISEESVTRLGNQLLATEFKLPPTMFDYCLAMAVLYFKEQQVDIMVMETGIGGRYDSTNALGVPEVAVITKIGLDHTAVLGDTLEQIAAEKAGIIKKGAPVVTTIQQASVKEVLLQSVAEETTFYEVSQEDLRYAGSLPMKMLGKYQIENAATAILAARVLFHRWGMSKDSRQRELSVPMQVEQGASTDGLQEANMDVYIKTGVASTTWNGRMELINKNPFFLIDGAHNSHGVHALASSLQELYPGEKFHFIMGVMADKDYEEMIAELLPLAIDFVTVTPESDRAMQSKDLAECITAKGVKATYADGMAAVIKPLLPQSNCKDEQTMVIRTTDKEVHVYLTYREHKTVAFGSLYFIGTIESMLEENKSKGQS